MHLAGRTRRRLLKELGAVAALWPAARLLQSSIAHAQEGTAPKRLLLLFTPHGRSKPHWLPRTNADGTLQLDFTEGGLRSTLGPLQAFSDQLVVVDGLDMACGYAAGRQGHEQGTAGSFTGAAAASTDGQQAHGPSVDLLVYEHLLSQGVSMPAGLQVFGLASRSMCFHSSVNGVWQRSSDPRESRNRFSLFEGVDTGDTGPDPAVVRRNLRRRAAIDYARERVASLRGDLGALEREKLDTHVAALESVRRRFDEAPPPAASCEIPARPSPYPTFFDGLQSPALAEVQGDLITQLFACDLTRVQAWMLGDSFTNVIPRWLDRELASHDTLVHGRDVTVGGTTFSGPVWDDGGLTDNCPPANADYTELMRWYVEQAAVLFGKMHAIPEENGRTMLENTVVLMMSDMGNPAAHWNTDLPIVVAGGGAFAGNRLLRLNDTPSPGDVSLMRPHNQVLVSVAQAFGVETDVVGDPQFAGRLAEL